MRTCMWGCARAAFIPILTCANGENHFAAVQSSNAGGQANAKRSPAGNGADGESHGEPSSAAVSPEEAAEQQPRVAGTTS